MTCFLSGDIGGTKTLLQLSATADEHAQLLKKSYASAEYASLEDMIDVFLAEAGVRDIRAACFALAGPVSGRVVKLTNLPWKVDGDYLAERFSIDKVALINDFEAVAYGVPLLHADDFHTLQANREHKDGVKLVVGAGTGLGVAWLTWQQNSHVVYPSEGGHMDFAPVDDLQSLLLRYLQHSHGHVSYERIVSGPGLAAIYQFMHETGLASPSLEMIAAIKQGDIPAAITRFAENNEEPIARMTVDLFLAVYGAFLGNLALASLPRGGIYIAGGIAAKISTQMSSSVFLESYLSKGRYRSLLASLPVHIILNTEVGLMGANYIARRQL